MHHDPRADEDPRFGMVLDAFAAGWAAPAPHAWDGMLAADVELVQPMLRTGRGRELWHREMRRLLRLMPDLRGEVLRWSGRENSLSLHIALSGTLGGKPLRWEAMDLLDLDPAGTVVRRESFFDSVPLILTILRRPRAWLPWLRTAIGKRP